MRRSARVSGNEELIAQPVAAWLKDPLIERLTFRRIKAALLRRARALFART